MNITRVFAAWILDRGYCRLVLSLRNMIPEGYLCLKGA